MKGHCGRDNRKPGAQIGRRRFLQLAVAGLFGLTAARRLTSTVNYQVGIGQEADPYAATERAVHASRSWPAGVISGRKVIIKPNLVLGATADTGITTDPQVVRAIVDMALAPGAPGSTNFSTCGYDFFKSYAERVSLVDLQTQPVRLADIPNGLAYHQIYMSELLFGDDVVFISAGKMKCHAESLVTLSVKNLFGLPPMDSYAVPPTQGRFAMHDRGVNQAIVDINLVRPVDFAVVDGIWAMEGTGPWGGIPVRMNLVVAGDNAMAVDRVCLMAMGIPQAWVQHLAYGAYLGLGPADMGNVQIYGDTFSPRVFLLPDIPQSWIVQEVTLVLSGRRTVSKCL